MLGGNLTMEDRKFEIVNDYGPEVNEIRLRYKTNNEGTHYAEGMHSGPQDRKSVV